MMIDWLMRSPARTAGAAAPPACFLLITVVIAPSSIAFGAGHSFPGLLPVGVDAHLAGIERHLSAGAERPLLGIGCPAGRHFTAFQNVAVEPFDPRGGGCV